MNDKNNNISFEGLDIHFHKYRCSSYLARSDTFNNVRLDLLNPSYSIYILQGFVCNGMYWIVIPYFYEIHT